MVNYDILLNLVSIVLVLLILFMILFGCKRNGRHYFERFENPEEEKEEQEEKPKEKKEKKVTEKFELSQFENQILNQLSSGQLTTEAFTNLIATEKFTQKNLENMINYVEATKGEVLNEKEKKN